MLLAWAFLFFLVVKKAIFIIKGLIRPVKFGVRHLILQIALTVLLLSILTILILTIPRKEVSFTKGFLERMKNEADIPTIQAWVDNLDLKTVNCKVDEYGWWIDESEWPEAINKINTSNLNEAVLVKKTANNKTYVRVLFGTALLGRWALVVGVDDDEIPLNDFYESEYRLELSPKAFVGYRIRD